jgi:Zn/Cd-binding protein ZinT
MLIYFLLYYCYWRLLYNEKCTHSLLVLFLLLSALFGTFGCSSDDDDDDDDNPQTLSEWSGRWPAATSWLTHTDVAGALATAAAANGVTSKFLNDSYTKMIGVDFYEMEIEGNTVKYATASTTLTVSYSFAQKFGEGEEAWYAFESPDNGVGNKKYLILLPPEQHSEDTPLHWHFRYGGTSFEALLNDAMWYGTVFAEDTTDASVAA